MKRLLGIPEVLNDIERVNNSGQTGLDIAMEKGHTEVAETIKAIKQLNHPGNYVTPPMAEKHHFVFAS